MEPNNSNHVLIESTQSDSRRLLFKIAFHEARRERSVLYIATTPLDRIPISSGEATDDRLAKRIHFMYVSSSRELTDRLALLHTWSLRPALIIVEALDAFCTVNRQSGNHNETTAMLVHAAAMLATLHDYAAVMAKTITMTYGVRRPETVGEHTTDWCRTVCSISARSVWHNKNNLPDVLTTLKRLYYFQDNSFLLAAGNAADDDVYDVVIKYLWK